jgi:hypothetical protein
MKPFFAVCASLTALCGVANAQSFWGDYRASTPGQAAAMGMADVTRAAGQYNLDSARALTEVEVARDLYLDNRMKATQTFFEMRKMNREYRKAERGAPLTYEQMYRLAQVTRPRELDSSQLDPVTGGIAWPAYLQAEKFADLRGQIEKLFGERAHNGVLAGESYVEAMRLTEELLDKLREDIRIISPSTFMQNRRFIESLQRMARQSA